MSAARRAFEAGRAAWPAVALDPATFEAYYAQRAGDAPSSAARAADMYLACACSIGVDEGLLAFEREMLRDIAGAAGSIDPTPTFVDVVVQAVLERLLVGTGRQPRKIADYGGRPSLRRWVRATAVRLAIDLRRGTAAGAVVAMPRRDGTG
jgi:RNA polymerase sigma-70 factor